MARRRKERKGAGKLGMAIYNPVIPDPFPVIPAKAGIQSLADRLATRNKVQITVSGSPLP